MEHIKLNIQRFADGKVVIETDLNEKGFSSGLSKMQSIASKGFGAIAKSVGVASGAIAGLIGSSVKMAGDLEQQMGGAESVFKDLGKTIDDIKFKSFEDEEGKVMSLAQVSKEAFSTMGISANDYLQNINKMGALMQGAGIKASKALDLSGQAMQRAADIASIMGVDVNFAMESIAGAAKGNFTMMDNLGVAMNATTIEAYAMSKGIKKSYNEMDNATKVGLAMEMFLEKTEYATGNYIKENKTFAGSFSTLKAATSNFLSGAGGIEDVADALIDFSEILVTSIGEISPKIVDGLIKLTETLIPQIPLILEKLMPSVLEGAISLINGLVAIFPALLKMIQDNLPSIVQGGITIIKTLITTILDMLPEILKMGVTLLLELIKGISSSLPELIPIMVTVIMDMVNILLDNIDLIIEAGIQLLVALTEGIMNALPELVSRLPEIIIKIVSTLINLSPQLLSAALRIIMTLAEGLIKYVPELISRIPQIIKSMVGALKQGVKDFINVGKNLINGLWKGIKSAFEKAIDGIITFFTKTIPNAFDSFVEFISGIPDKIAEFFDKIVVFFTETIPEAISSFVEKVKEFFDKIPYYIGYVVGFVLGKMLEWRQILIEFITEDIPNFINSVIEWFKALPGKIWEFILNIIDKIKEWGTNLINFAKTEIPKFINSVIDFFKELPGKIWNAITNAVSNIKKWGGEMVAKGKEAASNVVSAIVNTIKKIPGKMLDIGKDIVEGIWNGINNAKDWVIKKVKNFAKGILDGMKDALGIHSPSKLFRDEVGKFIAQGVGVGFTDELENVYHNMQRAIDLETSKMSANVQTSGTYQMAMAGLPTFNLLDNTNNTTQLVVNGKVLAEVVNIENRNREVATA